MDKTNKHLRAVDKIDGVDLMAKLRPLLKKSRSIEQLADALGCPPKDIRTALAALQEAGYSVRVADGQAELTPVTQSPHKTPQIVHDLSEYEGKWFRFGVCGDKHMGNMQSRLDVMNLLYDLYEAEGITTVYDTGNWIDGECRFNKNELLVHGMDNQLDYLIDNHPKKKDIITHYVAGDDHEGWYQQREGVEIGKYLQLRAEAAGRNDLKYLGYAESLVELKAARGSRMMMVNHPGGGASYAISYKSQRYADSLQGGEKPAIVLQGHYHKFNVGYPREIFAVDTGTCCDQTLFMRKRQIQAHVGGLIVEVMQAPDGRIARFRTEFLPFYDRGFYETQRRHFGLPKGVKAR